MNRRQLLLGSAAVVASAAVPAAAPKLVEIGVDLAAPGSDKSFVVGWVTRMVGDTVVRNLLYADEVYIR